MKATFKVLEAITLDGKDYKKGETFTADANLKEHFESNKIAVEVKEKTETK
jgi:hypothetical protein